MGYKQLEIRQTITAGSNWNAADPGTTPAFAGNVKTYPQAAVGGKVVFNDIAAYVAITGINVTFGGATSWSVKLTDGTHEVVLAETLSDTLLIADRIRVPQGWWLALTSAGAATAQFAAIHAQADLPDKTED